MTAHDPTAPADSLPPSGAPPADVAPAVKPSPRREIGGPAGPEPTRYGDWEVKGRCSDF
jgi:hypothetical protein